MVVCGGDAFRGILPDGASAGDGSTVPGKGVPAGLLLCRVAFR